MGLNLANFFKLFEKISINTTYLIVGAFLSFTGPLVKSDLVLKIGLLTLFFGGVFRFLGLIVNRIPLHEKIDSFKDLIFSIIKFLIWIVVFTIYGYFLNNLIQIF